MAKYRWTRRLTSRATMGPYSTIGDTGEWYAWTCLQSKKILKMCPRDKLSNMALSRCEDPFEFTTNSDPTSYRINVVYVIINKTLKINVKHLFV